MFFYSAYGNLIKKNVLENFDGNVFSFPPPQPPNIFENTTTDNSTTPIPGTPRFLDAPIIERIIINQVPKGNVSVLKSNTDIYYDSNKYILEIEVNTVDGNEITLEDKSEFSTKGTNAKLFIRPQQLGKDSKVSLDFFPSSNNYRGKEDINITTDNGKMNVTSGGISEVNKVYADLPPEVIMGNNGKLTIFDKEGTEMEGTEIELGTNHDFGVIFNNDTSYINDTYVKIKWIKKSDFDKHGTSYFESSFLKEKINVNVINFILENQKFFEIDPKLFKERINKDQIRFIIDNPKLFINKSNYKCFNDEEIKLNEEKIIKMQNDNVISEEELKLIPESEDYDNLSKLINGGIPRKIAVNILKASSNDMHLEELLNMIDNKIEKNTNKFNLLFNKKRTILEAIINLNPGHERAKRMLDEIN